LGVNERVPILLDTDPGSDIDDALAIMYLLRQPRCELLGITTVTGDTVKRAGITDLLCRAYGREDIPIVAGAQDTLAHGPGQPFVPQYDPIAELSHRTDFVPNQAVDFLRETIRSRPGEITLLSIGPLTNVAILFALDPEIPSLLAGFTSMLGYNLNPPYEEWNSKVDPAANEAVMRRSIDHRIVGLDVTLKCQMQPDEVRERFGRPPHEVVLPMATKWFEGAGTITFHDPLAAATLFESDMCKFERGKVTATGGAMSFEPDPAGPHFVASEVDASAFFRHYFDVLG
jgi:purine nucleosidase